MNKFASSLGNTWRIMKDSANILRQDKELAAFPVMGVLVSLIFVAIAAGIIYAIAGDAATTALANGGESVTAELATELGAGAIVGSVLIAIVTYMVVVFTFTFFNAALVAGALQRIQGGDPTIRSSLGITSSRFGALFGWALIAGTVSLIVSSLRSRAREQGGAGGIIAALGLSLLIAVWEFITFFSVPVIINERKGPIAAIKRSYGIVKQTWGSQIVAHFGFGLFYFLVALPGLAIGALLFLISPVAGFVVGGFLLIIGIGLIHTLASIFKAVLYHYAVGPEISSNVAQEKVPESIGQYQTFRPDFLSQMYTPKKR